MSTCNSSGTLVNHAEFSLIDKSAEIRKFRYSFIIYYITVTLDHEVCENFSITYCKGIANSLQK